MLSGCRITIAAAVALLASIPSATTSSDKPSQQPHESSRPRVTRPIAPDEEAQVLAFVREFDPDLLVRAERLKGVAPDRYGLTIRRMMWVRKHLDEARARQDSTPYAHEVAEIRRMSVLQMDAEDIVVQFRTATDESQRAQLRADLTSKVGQALDIWEQLKRDEVERMSAELERLKRIVEDRDRKRASIVERHVRRMLGEADADD